MTNDVTGASERHEDRGAVGSPVERPVGPGPIDALHLELVGAVSADWAISCEIEWRRRLQDPADITAAQIALLRLSIDVERLRRVLSVVRRYPDFDSGGPLAEAMDQALAGKSPELLEALERLVAVGAQGPNTTLTGSQR